MLQARHAPDAMMMTANTLTLNEKHSMCSKLR